MLAQHADVPPFMRAHCSQVLLLYDLHLSWGLSAWCWYKGPHGWWEPLKGFLWTWCHCICSASMPRSALDRPSLNYCPAAAVPVLEKPVTSPAWWGIQEGTFFSFPWWDFTDFLGKTQWALGIIVILPAALASHWLDTCSVWRRMLAGQNSHASLLACSFSQFPELSEPLLVLFFLDIQDSDMWSPSSSFICNIKAWYNTGSKKKSMLECCKK